MGHRLVLAAAPLGLLVALAACGEDEEPAGTADDPRVVEIDMVDIDYEPDAVDVQEGETVRFVFTNEGAIKHDAFVGDEAAQDAHEDEMRGMEDDAEEAAEEEDMGEEMEDEEGMDDDAEAEDDMDMGGSEEGITVEPGETGEIVHTFDEPGELLIGCHEEDHYEAGMIVTIDVS